MDKPDRSRSERCNEQESMQGSAAAAKVPQTQIQVLEVKGIHVKGSPYSTITRK